MQKVSDFIIEHGQARYSSLLKNHFSPFGSPYHCVEWSSMKPTGFGHGRDLPELAKKHVYMWLTCVKNDKTNNVIASLELRIRSTST